MNRLATAIFAATLLSPLTTTLHAQTAAPTSTPLAPPMLPVLTHYQYWPVQFVQFVGSELPYSMIMLEANPNGKHPLLEVTLTERASGKRVHYTDNDLLLATAVASGDEAHKTNIAYEPADSENTGSVTNVRFTLPDGKPLQWRFVQGSDISEQGSGLNPFPGTKIPVFAYREQGGVAGEGTVLQIGDVVSNAEVWREISKPPYFVGYHGAETAGAHTLVFRPGSEAWTVQSAPTALTGGATWELEGDHGDHRSVHIDKWDGTHITVTATDRFQPGVHCTLDAVRSGDGWNIERARFAPDREGEKHFLTLQFAQPLFIDANTVSATLLAGRKTTLATATFTRDSAGSTSFKLSFTNPSWLRTASLSEEMTAGQQGITISAHAN